MSKECICGCTTFATSNDGSVVCTNCGTIKESANIVSEVTFGDNSSIVGTFVSATRRSGSNYRSLGGRDSRALSLDNARRRLDEIGTSLKIRPHHIDSAQRSFELAMENNFTKGRKTKLVAASCLYIVCRREKTPHLLIDFSEVLQVNVFVLGHTFLQLIKLLNIQLPIVDPSLFIFRFASSLEFGSQTKEVTATANKLVARMKRDWMCIGRKPSGICGASLYIAAKIHGFKRSMKEIIHIVKIGESTLLARLEEFRRTPSASLKFSEFEEMDIEDEWDPPSYTNNRLKEKLELEKKEEEKKKIEKKALKKLKRREKKLKKQQKETGIVKEEQEEKEKEEEEEQVESKLKEEEEEEELNNQIKDSEVSSEEEEENILDSDLDEYDESITSDKKRKKKKLKSNKDKKKLKSNNDEEELEKESIELAKQSDLDLESIVSGSKTLDSVPSTLLDNIDKFEEIENNKKKNKQTNLDAASEKLLKSQTQSLSKLISSSSSSSISSLLASSSLPSILTPTLIMSQFNNNNNNNNSQQSYLNTPIPQDKTLSSQVSYPPLPSEVDPTVFEPNDNLQDLNDDELDFYLEKDKDLVKKKGVIWEELNKEWIQKNEERQKEIEEDIKAGRPPRKRKQVSKKSAENAAAAAEEELKRKNRNAKLVEQLGLFKPNFYGEVLGGGTSSSSTTNKQQTQTQQQTQQQTQKQSSQQQTQNIQQEEQGGSLLSQQYDSGYGGGYDDFDEY